MELVHLVFSSLIFLYLFLPITLAANFLAKSIRVKNTILLIASLLFYAWGEPVYVLLMAFSAAVNYFAGLLLERFPNARRRTLAAAVAVNLLLLGFFKYTGFLVENLNALGFSLPVPKITLPIGISFFTFQAMSYVIDAYRGKVGIQHSYKNFLLYVSMFPQLIAGPIVRYADIERQINKRSTTPQGFFHGMTRFCVGLGKKVLIANYCAKYADELLASTSGLTTAGAWLGVILFTFQIYFDFSGYSDMAIGLGKIFGFRYLENFNLPYCASSITDFWRRWHISLSSFFRDYVYIPLGGNRCSAGRQVFNLFVVWALTGLWHGASWNFVLWGLYFFVLLVFERRHREQLARIPSVLRHLMTLLLIVISWTIFYFTKLSDVGAALGAMFLLKSGGFTNSTVAIRFANLWPLLLVCIIGSSPLPRAAAAIFRNLFLPRGKNANRITAPALVHTLVTYLFDLLILYFSTVSLVGADYNPFIYFRF